MSHAFAAPAAVPADPTLLEVLRAITIHSPSSFQIGDETIALPAQHDAFQAQAGYGGATGLVGLLQQQLYQRAFCSRFGKPAPTGAQPDDPHFVQRLSAANTGRDRWEGGWTVRRNEPSGQLLVEKGGRLRLLWPGEFVAREVATAAPRPGTVVTIFAPRGSLTFQPGFYFAFGETLPDQIEEQRVLRFYWNVDAEQVPELIHRLTRTLNRFQVPFRLKCLTNPAAFARIDAAVLYVGRRYYAITRRLLEAEYAALAQALQPETPLFTKELAPGLGFAEDPADGQSFGMSRCRIVAEGIWSAFCQGSQAPEIRLRETAAQFARYGLSFERPYLNPGGVDRYAFTRGS